jgi:hypothetical protein
MISSINVISSPVNVPDLKARLTRAGVPWESCNKWKMYLNQLSVYGSNAFLSGYFETIMTYGVPTNKLPLLIGVHHTLDQLIGRVLNGDTQNTSTPSCTVMNDIKATYDKAIVDASEQDILNLGFKENDPAISLRQYQLEVPTVGYGRSHPDPMALWLSKNPYEHQTTDHGDY